MERLMLIYNPRAGRGMMESRLAETIDYFTKNGFLVTAYPTQGTYDFEPLRELIAPNTRLVYAGGDGMLNAAVNFQMRFDQTCSISYLPMGTTNDFARSVGISANYEQALETALTGIGTMLDIGRLNDRYFVYVAAFGVFTDISYKAPQNAKNMFGYLAYVLEGIKGLSELKTYYLNVRYQESLSENDTGSVNGDACEEAFYGDGMQQEVAQSDADDRNLKRRQTTKLKGEFLLGMITNSFSVAGFRNLLPEDVSLTDGMFEVLLIKRPQNVLDLKDIAAALISGNMNNKNIFCFKCSSISIESEEVLDWTLDGEFGGRYQKTEIEVLHEGVSVRC